MIIAYFLWFDYWTFKGWKTIQNHSVLAYYLHKWLMVFCDISNHTQPLFCRPGPLGLGFYWSGPAHLPNWLGMLIVGWLGSLQSEIFLQMKFFFLEATPLNRLPFYLGSMLHITSPVLSHFFLLQNVILHKMLKLGFWNFKAFFLRMPIFHWFQHFFL